MCACAVNPWAGGQVLSRKKPFLEYLSETLNKFDLRKHIRFGENVESARFSSDNSEWTLGIRDMETQLRCTFLVFCTGYFKHGTCRAITLLACIMIYSSFAHLFLANSATPPPFQSRATPRSFRGWRVTRARSFIRRSGMLAWFAKTRKSWSSAVARPQPHSSPPLPTPWPPSPCFKGHPATGRASR